jgi:ABC-type antimicrobial peptide transport system permease subunit
LLAVIGTYGALSYAVSRQRREIGIRIALGAQASEIRRQFVWLGLRLLMGGTALGLAGAWMAGTAMQGLLYNVPALHVPVLGTAAVVMLAATLAACLGPSHRAARISPVEAMNPSHR